MVLYARLYLTARKEMEIFLSFRVDRAMFKRMRSIHLNPQIISVHKTLPMISYFNQDENYILLQTPPPAREYCHSFFLQVCLEIQKGLI